MEFVRGSVLNCGVETWWGTLMVELQEVQVLGRAVADQEPALTWRAHHFLCLGQRCRHKGLFSQTGAGVVLVAVGLP